MLIAQALAEYGLLDSVAAGVQKVFDEGSLWIQDAGPGTWVAMAAVAVGLIWFFKR